MELYGKDPIVTRALTLALMRQALEMLDAIDEPRATCHLQIAIDALSRMTGPGSLRQDRVD